MADVHSKEARSYNMSRVRSKNTNPEMLVRKYLHGKGFRYTLHNKALPGKPDIVLPKYKTVILVHGCFWHGHADCKYFSIPKTRTRWWADKIDRNITNDKNAKNALNEAGWRVIEVWGCELKNPMITNTLDRLTKELLNREDLL